MEVPEAQSPLLRQIVSLTEIGFQIVQFADRLSVVVDGIAALSGGVEQALVAELIYGQ